MESTNNTTPVFSILLVEDEAPTLELLATILPKKYPGALLHTAHDGRKGLDLFKTHTPDIVITDFNMPEMCGAQMVDKIRAIKPDTKIIVITGKSEKPLQQNFTQEGVVFDHFIAKPVVFQELFTAIDQCLGDLNDIFN